MTSRSRSRSNERGNRYRSRNASRSPPRYRGDSQDRGSSRHLDRPRAYDQVSSSRDSDRDKGRDRDRGRDRDGDRERDQGRNQDRDRDQGRDRDRKDRSGRDDYDDRSSRRRRDDRDEDRDRRSKDKESSRRRRSPDSGSESDGRGRSKHSSSKKKSKKDTKSHRETSEERALRKAERKKEKEERAKAIESAVNSYSNSDNPFNDANLAQKFTWAKKREAERKKGISSADAAKRDVTRREEAKTELEKLNKRRNEREREKEEREEEMARIQRATEQAQLGDWQAQEEVFHLKQAKRRAEIRIKSNRAKPIDILAMNIKLVAEDVEENEQEDEDDLGMEIDVEEPYTIFENLTLESVQELFHDIKFYLSLEKDDNCIEFWRAMLIVCEDKLSDLNKGREQSVVAPHIAQDIASKLVGKTYSQLTLLQDQIQRKLSGGGVIDVDYWEALLKTLIVWKAKAKLNVIHQEVLQKRLEQLKARQLREAEKEKAELAAVLAMQSHEIEGDVRGLRTLRDEDTEYQGDDIDDVMAVTEPYDASMDPEPMDSIPREDSNLAVVDQWEDWAEILEKRHQVLNKQFNPKKRNVDQDTGEQHPDDDFVAKILFDKEAAKQLAGNEQSFNIEASIQRQQTYMWQDKYRPRKPRFFNRVHTGYEWNKYNQTHYDHDNPPPKVVQGYKFNLFYPDLIDKSQAPTYEIIKEPGTQDTVLIKFRAGPPYEDIAFKIVNREWEHSHKKGYKSVFDRGVLQLHFNFKRQFYRR